MTTISNRFRQYPGASLFSASFVVRLGGIVGLLSVALGVAAGRGLTLPIPALEQILPFIPNLGLVVWMVGVYALQPPQPRRLGLLGLIGAATSITFITLLNFIRQAAGDERWAINILESPALPLVYVTLAVSFVWGILALGTTSLQSGALPRGVVVAWTIGLMALLVANWPPISLVASAALVWSSIVMLRGVRAKDLSRPADPPPATATAAPQTGRLAPLDALRGLIMVLMAIDHASYFIRRWHPFEVWSQPLPDYPSLAAMFTRLATHPCAPGFYFLMGAGMVLFARSRRQLGWSGRRIAGHLALRGLLFIILEQLIVDVASAGQIFPLDFSILAGLGVVMLLGLIFLGLSAPIQAGAGAAIILLMQVLPGLLLSADLGAFGFVRLLLLPGAVGSVSVLYPPLPWLGVALLGMAFGRLLMQQEVRAYRVAAIAGLVCLAFFPLVRALGGFGNLRMPAGQTLIDFFNVIKYPPSLSFLLLSLGLDLVVLYLFSRAASWLAAWGRPLVVLGQAALYFFLVHWFVYAALGLASPYGPERLPQTYLGWAIGLVLLYPVCKAFEAFKHRMPVASVWRML